MRKVYSTATRGLAVLLLLACFSTFLSADNYYWVNGSGAWSDFAGHWAKIPNPTLPAHYHANIPTDTSDVYFGDTNGGTAYTVNVDGAFTVPKCRNMDWTGVPVGTVWGGGGGQMDIYGSLAMDANMSMTFNNEIHFISNDAAMKQIWSKTVHFLGQVYFEGPDGGWQFQDDIYFNDYVGHTGGLIETNSYKVTVGSSWFGNYYGSDGQLHLGSSEFIIVDGTGWFYYLPSQFDAGTSHIKFMGNNCSIAGGTHHNTAPHHFYDISFFGNFGPLYGGFGADHVDGTLTFHQGADIISYNGFVPVLNNVVLLGDGYIANAQSYNHLTLTAGKTYTFAQYQGAVNTDQTILPGGTLTAVGAGTCSQFITIKSWQYGTAVKFINNSGADIMTGCIILEDVHADGTNTLTVNDGVNLGNTTGWIFVNPNPGIDLYWVGGTGDWNDPCHWTDDPLSLTGDCGCLPNGASNVHFTANSGFSPGDKVTVSADAYCANMDWTGVTGEPEIYHPISGVVNLHIYDSLTLSPDMDFNFGGTVRFRTSDTATITSIGQDFDYKVIFEGTGVWELQDTFKVPNHYVFHERGTFNTLGHPMLIHSWLGNWLEDASSTRVNMGAELFLGEAGGNSSNVFLVKSTYLNVKGAFRCFYEAGKFHAVESHIIGEKGGYIDCYPTTYHDFWNVTFLPIEHAGDFLYGNILNKLTFLAFGNLVGPNSHIHEVEFHKGSYTYDSHTYDILTIHGGYAHKYQPWSGTGSTTQTITTGGVFNHINTSCENPTVMYNPTPGETTTFRKEGAGTAFDIQHTIFDRVYADQTSGAIYTATNCVAIQPDVEAAWNIANPVPRDLYWVGGAGDWHSAAHWSLASGGAGGECPPTPHDDVFFDGGSGLGGGDAVTVSQKFAFCKDMDWTGVGNGTVFDNTNTTGNDSDPHARNNFSIFGSLKFSSAMTNNFIGSVWMRAKGAATITSAGNHLKWYTFFWEPMGDWIMNDALFVDKWVDHRFGILRSNNHSITVGSGWEGAPTESPSAELYLGSSTMTILSNDPNMGLYYGYGNFNYEAGKTHLGTSSIVFEDYYPGLLRSRYEHAIEFFDVTFEAANSGIYYGQVNGKVIFEKSGRVTEGFFINDLEFQDDGYFNFNQFTWGREVHSIRFAPGKRYEFGSNYKLTLVPSAGIEGQFIAQGLPGQYIEMKSSNPSVPATIHMDDYNGTSTCTKYLFLTGMTHTGTEDIYVPTPGGDVFNNTGWQFFSCNPCPATIPVLDVANSITTGCPPGTAKLVLAGLKADEWANWYTDPAATTDLVYSGGTPGPAGNMFMPTITGPVTYYARVYSDGGLCESTVVLSVDITITAPPAAFNVTGGGLVCAGSNGTPLGLDGSVAGVSYQLQLDGSDVGAPLAGTDAALDFGLQTAAGTYTVVATTDGTACSAVMTGSAVVTGSPNQAPAVVVSSNAPLCAGPADLLLFESGGAATSWIWSGPGGFASSDQNPVIANPAPANSGMYTVVVSDGLGCTNIGSVGVAVAASAPTAVCPSGYSVCIGVPPFALIGATPAGGGYSGAGVSQDMFDPTAAGVGQHTITYTAGGGPNCESTCTFPITVPEETLPIVVCDEFTTVALGADCMALVDAKAFDHGSFDYCSDIFFKVRRLLGNGCEPDDRFYDQMQFCAADLGQTLQIVMRVYDVPVPGGGVDATFEASNANDCAVEVTVQDKLKPTCTAPGHVTVSCENFDPSLFAYGFATGADNCCLDTVTVTDNRILFDSICNRGTITRTFRAFDCGGLSSTCTQRIVVNYVQNFYIKFPDDVLATNCSPTNDYGEPELFGADCELLGVGFEDLLIPVVPDACFKIFRTWRVVNWCAYDPNLGCTEVPNPNPNANANHPTNLPGPTVSAPGAQAPWAPTVVAILPGQQPTNYSTFWSASASCYKYTQIIKVLDSYGPVVENCPSAPVSFCDPTANNTELWNEPYWLDPASNSNDLNEAAADLTITATDQCSGSNIAIRYLLFLDLDNNGIMETVVNSANLPGFNTVNFDNAQNPNFSGGTPRAFDERSVPADEKYGFALQTTVSGNNKTAAVRWNTQQAPNTYTVPELPRGTHKIKWFVEDGCGNETVCEYAFTIKSDCNAPTVACNSCVNADLPQSQSVTVDVADVLQHTEDDVTPQNLLITAIRKAGVGSGFPGAPPNNPQTSIEFGCSELGLQQVEVWSLDEAGNSAFCLASVIVNDPLGVCGGQPSYPDLTFCPGENAPAIPLSGPAQGATYSWLNDNPGIGLEVMGMGDIPSFVAANNTAAALTAVVQVYTHFGGCPSPDPVSFTITVHPAQVVFAPGDVMVCQGENTAPIQFSGSLPGMTFSWTNDNPAIGLGASGTGDIPPFPAENSGSVPVSANIHVVGGGVSGLLCPDPVPTDFTIFVKPTPMVTDPDDQVLCAGKNTSAVHFTGNLPNASFFWTNDNPAIGLASGGFGDIASFAAVNNTGAPITATITVTPQVGDNRPPTIVCINGLSVNMMPTGMIALWASDFLQYMQDNVTPADQLKLGIRKAGSGTGFPRDQFGNPLYNVTFDCSELGKQVVEVWSEDACGNADFCETYVIVLDNLGVCAPNSGYCISGKAVTEYGDGVEEVNVTVTGPGISQTVLTDNGGNYMFCNLPAGQSFEVCMTKDDNPLNGVSVYDLVLMSRHILGVETLDSPYKIIAADVDLTETVTAEDIDETRKLILGIYTEFPVADSWQFVPADHVFPNPANPFADPFPRGCKMVSLNGDVHDQDFIAIKTADLDGNAVANARPAPPKPAKNAAQEMLDCPSCPGQPMTFTITVQPALALTPVPTPPSCNGTQDGSINANASGGHPPYQYALNGGGFQNNPVFGGLSVGTYMLTVRDADGCTAQQQANLPQGPDQPLAIQCPTNVPALTANSSCQAFLGDYTSLATLSGGCGIPLNQIVQTPPPGTVVNPGTVAITLTVSNTAGQSATCVFNVTVSGGCGGN